MATPTRRALAALLATALFAAMAAEPVLAQGVAPPGGVSSTTAPSNSQGTPSGGTGVISTTRVAPAPMATPDTTAAAPRRTRATRHRARHHRRAAPRAAATAPADTAR